MLNQIILVGRITQDPKKIELENGKEKSIIILAVPRNYKNEFGIYDTDFLEVSISGGIAENVHEYYRKGDLVSVKGRVQSNKVEDKHLIEIIAEKVTFLSSRKDEDKGE